MSRLSATIRSMNFSDRGSSVSRRVTLVDRLRDLLWKRGNRRVEHVVLVQGDDAEPPAGTAEVLAVGVDADRIPRELAEQRPESGDEGPVDIVRQQHEVRTLFEDAADRGNGLAAERHRVRVAGIDDEEGLHLGIEQRGQIGVRELPALLLARLNEHGL